MFEPEDLTPLFEMEPMGLFVGPSGLNCYEYTGGEMYHSKVRWTHAALIVDTSTIVPETILAIFRPRK